MNQCKACGKDFDPPYGLRDYCSDECREKVYREQKRIRNRRYYYKHHDKVRARQLRYYYAHREEIRLKRKKLS